jgi:predicted Zn-dependent peptidase
MTRISRYLESLYGTAVGTDVSKAGEWQVLSFVADAPNERYLPTRTPLLERVLEFLYELIYQPAGRRGFANGFVGSEKDNLRKFILSLPEKRPSYALERLIEIMCEGEPFGRYEYGMAQDLKSITPANLFNFYRSMLQRVIFDVYVVGDVEPASVLQSIRRIFKHPRASRFRLSAPVIRAAPRRPRVVEEHVDASQCHLLMGYRCNAGFGQKTSQALAMAASVLGGFPHSKLFRIVREKESLAYSVHSHFIRSKGIMVVYAGVEPGTEAKARRLIEKQVAEIKAGRISSFELDSTKAGILDDIASITDSPSKEIHFHFVHMLHGSSMTPEEIGRRIASMTKKEITAAARKLKLDTVFTLTKLP